MIDIRQDARPGGWKPITTDLWGEADGIDDDQDESDRWKKAS